MHAGSAVLGSMLIDPDAVGPMLMAVSETDFQLPEQRKIFCAIRELYGEGVNADGVLVNERLGGSYGKYLAELIEVTPTSANADAYAKELKKSSRLWQLRSIGEQIIAAESEDDIRELVDKANLLYCERSGIRRVTMEDAFREFFRRKDGKETDHLKWGFYDLDEQLHVGRGDMVVIGGYPSAGKTAFALQLAFHIAKTKRVGFFSYETDNDKLYDRMVACQTHTSYGRITRNRLEVEDYARVKAGREHLTAPSLELLESSGMSVSGISAYAMAHHYDVIFVDYLQKIPGSRAMDEFQRVSQVSSDLQQLGRTTGKTVIALSQLSRAERHKDGTTLPPTLSSLRQSGQIEQDADVVMLLYKEHQDYSRSRRVLDLAKNKDGIAGLGLLLDFDGDKQCFRKFLSQPVPQEKPKEETVKQVTLFQTVTQPEEVPFEK